MKEDFIIMGGRRGGKSLFSERMLARHLRECDGVIAYYGKDGLKVFEPADAVEIED